MKKNTKKSSLKKSKPAKKVKQKRTPKPITEAAEYAEHAADQKAAAKTKKPEETMDRTALKAIAAQLKEMGSDIKVLKSDSDEQLQKKVNEQLQKMPTPDVLKKLESIVPDKLVTVLKRDCIGIFIDLSDVSCVRCKDSGKCASEFLKSLKGGLIDVDKALPDVADTNKLAEEKVMKLKGVTRYEADRLVFVRDVKNPNPVGDDYHDMLQAVLDEEPSTLSELREIVERDFDIDSDGDFMEFVTSMRDPAEGVIKLDVDLSEKNKAELRKAGVEI